ncbi:MAG: ferrous iron transport protein A [Firmicutes bacterium]|nr:ferrous iron transport protein A [Bacillota bacterium]
MDQFPLTRLAPGTTARIAGIRSTNGTLINKLAALGVLPGLPLTLIQTYPAYLVQIGQTELALDRETARCIEVII